MLHAETRAATVAEIRVNWRAVKSAVNQNHKQGQRMDWWVRMDAVVAFSKAETPHPPVRMSHFSLSSARSQHRHRRRAQPFPK